ncbi:MAG: MG2 domain-containing protein [Acidobacteriota bacterium]
MSKSSRCPVEWTRPFRLLLPLAVVVALAGCADAPEEGPPSTPEPPTQEAPKPKLDAADLAPQIRELAESSAAPSKLVIDFATPVVADSAVGSSPGDGTVLRIEPPVDGQLRFTGPSTLTFEPEEGFAPGRRYEVSLVSLETRDGVLEEPEAGRWTRIVETPAFGFLRASLGGVDYVKRRAEVDLVFSAGVEAKQVGRSAKVEVRDSRGRLAASPKVRFVAGSDPHRARAVISGAGVEPGATLKVKLDPVPAALDPDQSSAEARAAVELAAGEPVRVLTAYRAEGEGGFYIQVVCDDGSVESKRYFYDRETQEYFDRISTRCLVDEDDAASGLRFEPEVDFSIAASSGGFRVFGDFARGTYRMRLDAGVRTVDGGLVRAAFEREIEVPARSPRIRFLTKGRYLPRQAWSALPVRHMNVDDAMLLVRHVPAENLVFWMSDDGERADERNSDLIVRRKIPFRGSPDAESTSYVDLSAHVPPTARGLLEVTIQSGQARDTSRIILTDLHLVAKRAGPSGGIRVWALDVETTETLSGIDVQLVRKSGKVLTSCSTRGDAGCSLDPPAADVDPSPPFALLARGGRELTYLAFDEVKTEIQEARIAGAPYSSSGGYRAAVYTERGVYRPGETAHLAAILRDRDNAAPPDGMPAEVRLYDPRGKLSQKTPLVTNAAGYLTLDIDFPAFAATGPYRAEVQVAGNRVGEHRFQVEEFVPERMEVKVAPVDPAYRLGDPARGAVAARYLFGGVPAGHRVELTCELAPGTFAPTENANFHYGVWRDGDAPVRPLQLGVLTADLDDAGQGELECPGAASGPAWRGPAELVMRAAVFEAGSGRTSVARTAVPVHPEGFYLGLATGASKVEAGEDLTVTGVVVDWQGRRVDSVSSVALEFVRLETEWGWFFDETRGHERWRRYLRPVVEERTEVPVAEGAFRASWRPENDGVSFLVRAAAGEARTDLALEGSGDWYYWSPGDSESDRTPRPDRPTWIAVETPESIRVGEPFPVQLEVPYRGRLLVTTETDRLLSSRWIDVDAGETVQNLVLDELVPNLYVSAFLVKNPRLDSPEAFLPDRGFGVASVRVEPSELTHAVALGTPGEVRSGSRLRVQLDLGERPEGATFATVAAVDEGILSLTDFESPDPFRAIFARRALGIETFETVGWTLLVPPAGPSSTEGGDVQGQLGRVDGIKPVALWSGLMEVPASGELEVELDLPQYRGELRVMAVTAGTQKMGWADAKVKVRDPLVVQSTLPRFLTRGDALDIPVQVTNLSGRDRDVEVILESTEAEVPGLASRPGAPPPVVLQGPAKTTLRLADGAGDTAVFRARTDRSAGAAQLRVTVRSGDLESIETTTVPLLPAGPKSRRVQRIELDPGTVDVTPYLEGWEPLSEQSTLWVTANPYGDTFDHLKYLVRYPYGCLEQTTSSTRPLLYLAQLVEQVDPALLQEGTIEDRVQHGIDRLFSMQTPDGGFAYWRGGTQPADWASAYATHLLLDARKAGYPVTEERLDDALSWIERRISNHFEAGRAQNWQARAEPYMHFVLALDGRARKARMERLLGQLGGRPRGEQAEHRFMLQAGLYLAGDRRHEALLQSPDITALADQRDNGWTFYSDRRRRAFMLSTLVDLFGKTDSVERLAALVAGGLGEGSRHYTTQELAWGITGLGKLVQDAARDFPPPQLRAGGGELQPQRPRDGSADRTWRVARASEYDTLELTVGDRDGGELYLVLSSEGVRTEPDWRTGGEGLRLARRYLDLTGQPVEPSDLELGQLVYVELTLTNTSGARVANVALVDRIPAGFEIENPRLGRDGGVPWLDASRLWKADHMDLRDDRLEAFGHLESGQARQVVYTARAVTAGTFAVPAVEAEAMYEPRIWAREMGRNVTIHGPWSDDPGSASPPGSGTGAGSSPVKGSP